MKKIQTFLMSAFWGFLTFAVVELLLFETGLLESGIAVGNSQAEFITEVVMELMTLGNIWLSLRLFKIGKVKRDIADRGIGAFRKWGFLRLYLLGIPLVANVLFYELFLKPTFGYLAIIIVICLPFVYPSMARCESEVSVESIDGNEEVNNRHSQL